jgi:hypothetical protein
MHASLRASAVAPQRAVLRGARLAAAARPCVSRSRAVCAAAPMASFYDLSAKARAVPLRVHCVLRVRRSALALQRAERECARQR